MGSIGVVRYAFFAFAQTDMDSTSCLDCPYGVSTLFPPSRSASIYSLFAGYNTKELWLGYPHKEMTRHLKVYYLLQAAYWLQQTIILAAKIEKPRKDFRELVAHVRCLSTHLEQS